MLLNSRPLFGTESGNWSTTSRGTRKLRQIHSKTYITLRSYRRHNKQFEKIGTRENFAPSLLNKKGSIDDVRGSPGAIKLGSLKRGMLSPPNFGHVVLNHLPTIWRLENKSLGTERSKLRNESAILINAETFLNLSY